MSSATQRPLVGAVRLGHMKVTQFVSVLLYTSVFVTILHHADFKEHGFGLLTVGFFSHYKDENGVIIALQWLVLGGMLAINAIRYHLSFWSVEENEGFGDLCKWARKEKAERWGFIFFDFFLRITSYVVLFLIQLACVAKERGPAPRLAPEMLLLVLFFLLVLWDLVMLLGIWKHSKEQTASEATTLFKGDVIWWLRAETIAFVCMLAYVILTFIPGTPPTLAAMALSILGGCSVGIAVWDFVANRHKYRPIVLPLVISSSGVVGLMWWLGF